MLIHITAFNSIAGGPYVKLLIAFSLVMFVIILTSGGLEVNFYENYDCGREDLAALVAAYGSTVGNPAYNPHCDINFD
jgi:hypothetical protein